MNDSNSDCLSSPPESLVVQVDETGKKVRPVGDKKSILILREIPESTEPCEIEQLFSGQNCPKFISIEFVHNGTWYITFESEEDSQRAISFLREEVQTFQGKPIMVSLVYCKRCYSLTNNFLFFTL